MRPNKITLLTDLFLGTRNGFVTYKGSSHKLIPFLSKRLGRIYLSPEDRTIILSHMAVKHLDAIKPVERITVGDNSRKLFNMQEWGEISDLMQSSF